jgi:hypothetical protein
MMNATERRDYEMLMRLRDFGSTHRDLFAGSAVAQEAFASVSTAIDELTATDLLKLSASVSARADRKAMTRKTLIDLLVKASTLARVLKARGTPLPSAFAMPVSKSDQVLLTVGRQFARDAAPLEAEFLSYGVEPKLIADATTAFEAATRDRGIKRADHVAAIARIRELLAGALLEVRRLDLIVDGVLAGNASILAAWKQARRVVSTRTSRGSGASADDETATTTDPSPEPAPVTAPESTTDTPIPATVIDMPSREVA